MKSFVAILLWLMVCAVCALPSPFDPVSVTNPVELGYAPIKRSGEPAPQKPLYCFEDNRKTFPTNHWWIPAVRPLGPSNVNYITPLPYVMNIKPTGLEVSYPWVLAQPNVVQNIVNRHWTISSGANGYCVSNADEFTATFKWGSSMSSTIVRGSPYATINFFNSIASFATQQGIRYFYLNGVETKCNGSVLTGRKFAVTLRDSDEQWILYAPPQTSLICDASPSSFSLRTPKKYSGILRLAMANNCTTGMDGTSPHCVEKGVAHSDGEEYRQALDAGSNVCVSASALQAKHFLGIKATITWETFPCWKNVPHGVLLLIALPHHMPLFDCSSVRAIPVGGHRNLRGYCTPVQSMSNQWILQAPQQHIPWLGVPDKAKLPDLLKTLKDDGTTSDMYFDFPFDAAHGIIDPYNAGKLLAKIARLVLIAHQLDENDIHLSLLARLTKYLNMWLNHNTANIMLYDQSWGGIISCGCYYSWLEDVKHGKCKDYSGSLNACPTLTDPGFDFGNGFYNDHHFHYGYFIYSAAVVAKFNATWVKEYNDKVLVMVRDIANPSPADPYFAPFRYFDWYVGHSWASGLVANPLGRNQESTSEAVNAWYGIYLYGEATHNTELQTVGEAMFLMEVHSTNTYWHVPTTIQIYPKMFQHTMVGILHELLVEFQTYFGQSGYFVHGIQLLPITPVVHLMFHPRWVASGLPKFKAFCEGDPFCTESGFVAFYYAEWALVDKQSAWQATQKLSDKVFGVDCAGGNGNSRTNTLYFIASWGNHPEPNWTDLRQDECAGDLLPPSGGGNAMNTPETPLSRGGARDGSSGRLVLPNPNSSGSLSSSSGKLNVGGATLGVLALIALAVGMVIARPMLLARSSSSTEERVGLIPNNL